MTVEAFARDRRASWDELDGLLNAAHGRPQQLGRDGVLRLGALYREAAADLAIARRVYPAEPIVKSLEGLVGRAHAAVYGRRRPSYSLTTLMTTTYWQRILERPRPLLLSALVLFGPMVLGLAWSATDPAEAARFSPEMAEGVTEPKPEGADLGLSAGEQTVFAASIFTNNIRVTLAAFAGGISAGILTALALAFNGLLIGVVAGLATDAGQAEPLGQLVIPHGVLELSCIVVAGAAGFRLGWAVAVPGPRRRRDALITETRPAVEMAVGTAFWLVIAGLVEGYITPRGLSLPMATAVGFGLGAVFWGLALTRGQPVTPSLSA